MTEPKVSGCICQECAERGFDCTQIAPDNEDQCDECSMGVHEDERTESSR